MTETLDHTDPEDASFEELIEELRRLITELEEPDLTLSNSLAAFEKGVKVCQHAQAVLAHSEQKLTLLSEPESSKESSN